MQFFPNVGLGWWSFFVMECSWLSIGRSIMGYANFEQLLSGANAMDASQNHRFDANDPVV
jgi:hypothetical protein